MPPTTLEVCETFKSIQGEGAWTGTSALFIRLAGCNRRCDFCDTKDAWEPGKEWAVEQILEWIDQRCRHVVITGGEPFLQFDPLVELVKAINEQYPKVTVQIETNGDMLDKLAGIDPDEMNLWITVSPKGDIPDLYLEYADEIKWLVKDPGDISEAIAMALRYQSVSFSLQPISQDPRATQLCYRACLVNPDLFSLSVQLHKYLEVK